MAEKKEKSEKKKEKSERISWELVNNDLVMKLGDTTQKFDITVIFPEFKKYDEIQKMVIKNGIAQKLGDSVARDKDHALTATEKVQVIKKTWYSIAVDKVWRTKGVSKAKVLKEAKMKAQELVKKGLLSEEAFKTLFPA